MIEIEMKNGIWVATFHGGIIEYDKSLEQLLRTLLRRADEMEDDYREFQK